MIDKMTRYSFILLSGEKERFLKDLQDLGLMDITRSSKSVDEESSELMERADVLKVAADYLSGLEVPQGTQAAEVESATPAEDLSELRMKLDEDKAALSAARSRLETLKAWGGGLSAASLKKIEEINSALRSEGSQPLTIRYYKTPEKNFKPEWASLVPLEVISKDSRNVYFVTVSDDPAYTFPIAPVQEPEGDLETCEAEISAREAAVKAAWAKIAGLKKYVPEIEKKRRDVLSELDLYLAGTESESAAEDRLCVFTGFAPTEDDGKIAARLDTMDIYWTSRAAQTEDMPPIKLKNNKFVSMFQVLTDMYGRPAYDGFDPTIWISIFFMLFFAFCMGDMGYGLVLVVIGLLLKKTSAGKLAPLVVTLGAATTLLGFLFHTFFSVDFYNMLKDTPARYLMIPSDEIKAATGYDANMILALVIGIIHLCIAICIKTAMQTKNKGIKNSLGTWGWTLLIVGGVIVAALAIFEVLPPAIVKPVVIALGVVSAIGIFFLNDIHANPLVNFGSGLWATYNTVTGLLGDVLSYLRLYALGLAGSMLGYAFNQLGMMVLGDGGIGFNWIFFILLVVLGHTLNIAMCILGAFVHPLRLNFLEFFKNSEYDGSGRNYNPLKAK